ncbi:hypothetical protein PP715_13995 [Ralstonia solanacearum]|uniref:hypothetical protein n=1 Tax=Ralstonia solanacearum TaxID=305 RepID=UPI0005AD0FE6|nr:hypothetical protein [Ralstonia solanacearum]AMP70781.1 hypothetical protein UW163_15610 [Ralstonia solanacearum]MBB6588041.1 hypothetical protein [Ralstonia solanacearum]MCL9840963.1 hypothetical protein [Ralstonia solanacearum]MDB0534812.1 hypothetical protein [Ralstonia solanacearum]MDB0538245.1 hypothetical protein [Ralstonia solanacearum]
MTLPTATSDDSDNKFDLAALPDEAIHTLLIVEWLKCFWLNPDFEAYCEAKRTGDARTCAALEATHTRIAELYEDWGDIHALPSVHDNETVLNWYGAKQHLFTLPEATVADPLDWLAESDGTTLVAIPNGLRKEQLLQVLADFVSNHPELLGDGPKYEVTPIRGERPVDTLKRLHRAYPVYLMLTVGKLGAVKSAPAKAAKSILRTQVANRLFGFNWFVHGDVNKKLLEQDKLPADEVKGYTRTIYDLDKFYQASIDGTIRGVFPATTAK